MQICDENGYELTAGVEGDEACRIAQEMADERDEPVWLSEEGSSEMGRKFSPSRKAV